ncbi:MAG TPA: anion permease [Negativicutes bacterium]|nr:anion permease [Negativicutes bacterium]
MGKVQKAVICIVIGALFWIIPVPTGVKVEAWRLLGIFIATIAAFILQPLPIGAVAFISLVVTNLSGVLKLGDVLSGFSNGTIWLIVSAFLFAKGFIKTGLGRRIAYVVMRSIGDSTLKLGYAMLLSDLIIAPATPSNTARAGGVLFPILRGLASAFGSEPGPSARRIGSFLMVSTYQCVVISSAMFVTACAPNSLVVLLAAQTAKVDITWGGWALAAMGPGIISLVLVPYIVYKLYPPEITKTPEAKVIAAQELDKMGAISYAEKVVAGVFLAALFFWSTSQWTKLDATIVAMAGVAIMLGLRALEWNDVLEEKGAWDTMIWMGTLVSLAGALTKLGLIGWFAKSVGSAMAGVAWWVALLGLVLIYIYSHYGFASVSAHVTAMYAAFLAVAVAAGAPPYLAAVALAFATNLCSGLTHYAMGPAPIFFGAGYVSQADWWRIGFILSLVHIAIWYGFGWVWWKLLGLW